MFKRIFKRVVKVIKHIYEEVKVMANQIREDKKDVVLSVVDVTGRTIETVSNNKKELLLNAGHGCKEVVLSAGHGCKEVVLNAGHGCKEVVLSAGHGCKEMIERVFTDPNIKQTLGLIGIALLVSSYLPRRKEV